MKYITAVYEINLKKIVTFTFIIFGSIFFKCPQTFEQYSVHAKHGKILTPILTPWLSSISVYT